MFHRAKVRIFVFASLVICSILLYYAVPSSAFFKDMEVDRLTPDETDSLRVEIERVEEATSSARNAVQAFQDSVFLPELLFQLSEWELRREKLYFNFELLKYDSSMVLFEKDSSKFPEPEEPMLLFKETLALNHRLLTEFPDASFIDKVKYRTAICLYEIGERDSALVCFQELIESYPDSMDTPEINFRVAECFFDRQEFQSALEWYNEVLDFLDSPFFGMALYKRAWCYYKMNDYMSAISSFLYLLTDIRLLEEIDCELIGMTQGELMEEALEYIAISFTDYSTIDGVLDVVGRITEFDYTPAILAKMGDIYVRRDFYEEAIQASLIVIKRYPMSEYAPQAYHTIFDCLSKLDDYDRAMQLREEFGVQFGKGSMWARTNHEQRHQEMVMKLQTAMDFIIATPSLERADSLFAMYVYSGAAALYKNFLRIYPDDERADRVTYYLGDCLFELGDYQAAAVAYKTVVLFYPGSEWAEDAAFNRIVCYDQIDDGLKRSNPDTIRWRGYVLIFDSPIETMTIEACNDFIDRFGMSDRSLEIRLKLADIFLRREYLEPAERILSDVLMAIFRDQRGERYGAQALQLMAFATFKQGKFVNSEKYFEHLIRQYPDSLTMIENSRTMLASASYKVAESLKKSGDSVKAATKFEQTAMTARDRQVAESALFESAVEFKKADKLLQAALNFEKFSHRFPDSDRYEDALYQSAVIREQLSQWHLAAKNYMEIYQHDPYSAKGASALYAAGLAYERAQNWRSVMRTFDDFVAKFPNDRERRLEALFKSGYAREQNGNLRESYVIYNRILSEFAANQKKGEFADDYIAAQTHFRIGELMHRDFAAVKLLPPFELSMQRKQKLFSQMMKQLVDVARYNVAEWTTASFYTIGRSYEEFCQDILNSPSPSGLDQDQIRQYWDMIQDKWIKPLQREALRYYATNQKLAEQNGIDNHWVQQTRERITSLRDRLFAAQQKDNKQNMRPAVDKVGRTMKPKRVDM
ncbi:tetratricopeptide repeat protein [candidate division KSB1 bacterium]|nr:tetratricopeptide repeat protein [candidate division KSB1 bacterium]